MRPMPDTPTTASSPLDPWMNPAARLEIERRYWEPIESTGSLETLLADPKFESAPDRHISLFSDHSGTHARDVASRVLVLLDEHHGTLFATRDPSRFAFMKSLGVWLAYLHDVGMVDARPEGRKMHAQFAAQLVFRPEFDDIVGPVCVEGILADRVSKTIDPDPKVVAIRLREFLTMALCHSKSAMPTDRLVDLTGLRAAMSTAVLTDLEAQRLAWGDSHWTDASPAQASGHEHHYTTAGIAPFAWLDSPDPAEQELVADVLDTVRTLRVADALRQRGTDLRTSAGFEVFVDDTGQAVFHLAAATTDIAVQLRVDSPMSVGEANITSATLDPQGDLRIVLHRGGFSGQARTRVAEACATVIIDIALDVLDVFPLAPDATIQIERCDDDADFAALIQDHISTRSALGSRTVVVASLANSDVAERERYNGAIPVDWPSTRADEIWAALAQTGFRSDAVDAARCFSEVRVANVKAGEVVMREGGLATFVYIPTSLGLELHPGAGFAPQALGAWRRLGATAVLRRGLRNSTIAATAELEVVMVPGDVYANEWFRPFEMAHIDTIRQLLEPGLEDGPAAD